MKPQIHRSGIDAEFERSPPGGQVTIALNPYMEEVVTGRTAFGTTIDCLPVARFSIRRRPSGQEFRIVGRDGGDGPVREIRI